MKIINIETREDQEAVTVKGKEGIIVFVSTMAGWYRLSTLEKIEAKTAAALRELVAEWREIAFEKRMKNKLSKIWHDYDADNE